MFLHEKGAATLFLVRQPHIYYADRQSRTTAYRGKYPFPGYIEVVCIRIASFPRSKYIIPAPL